MFDRYEAGEQAVLVHVNFSDEGEREDLDELKTVSYTHLTLPTKA